MKLTIMNYDIDTDVEKDYQELSDKLSFLAIALYPKIDIKGVAYDYNLCTNTATILFKRNSVSYLDCGWIKNEDCQLITGLTEECFFPKVFGGLDDGYWGLIAYNGSWYAADDNIKRHFLKRLSEGAKDIKINFGKHYLEIKIIGANT